MFLEICALIFFSGCFLFGVYLIIKRYLDKRKAKITKYGKELLNNE